LSTFIFSSSRTTSGVGVGVGAFGVGVVGIGVGVGDAKLGNAIEGIFKVIMFVFICASPNNIPNVMRNESANKNIIFFGTCIGVSENDGF